MLKSSIESKRLKTMATSSGTLVVEELLIMLGLDSDDRSFNNARDQADAVVQGFEDIAKKAAIASGVVLGAVSLWVNQYADAANEVGKLARRVGGTVEEIQELDYVAEKSGLSVDFMRGAIEKLNAKAGQAASGASKDLSDTFASLNINVKEFTNAGPGAQMEMLADAMQKIPTEAGRSVMAMKLFEEEGLKITTAFEGGSAAVRQMREDARAMGLFNSEDTKRAEEYNSLMIDTRRSFSSIRNEVGAKLLPELVKILEWFKDFFRNNRELISQGVVGLFVALGSAIKILAAGTALWVSFKLGHYVLMAAGAMRGLTIATLAANAAVILIPTLIGIAIAAIAMLAQDIYGFFTGADSMIGRFAKRWPIIGVLMESLGAAVYDLIQTADGLLDILVGIVTLDWSKMEKGFLKVAEVITKHLGTLIDTFKSAFDTAIGYIPDFLKFNFSGNMAYGAAGAGGAVAPMPSVPSPSVTNSSNKSSVYQDNRQITVSGADILEVKRILKESNAYTVRTTTSGIER